MNPLNTTNVAIFHISQHTPSTSFPLLIIYFPSLSHNNSVYERRENFDNKDDDVEDNNVQGF